MTRITLSLAMVAAITTGCDQGPIDVLITEDLRIDGDNDQDPVDSFGTQSCVTEDGKMYVIWMDNRRNPAQDKVDIYMNRTLDITRVTDADTWLETPVRVNQGDPEALGPGNVWNPAMYCNELGVFIVWEDDRDGELRNHQIYFNRSTDDGETFLAEDILLEFDDEGNTMSLEPQITGQGTDLFVAWYDSANGAYDIFATTSGDSGDSWRDSSRIDSDVPAGSAYSARPKVAMSQNSENLWLVWEDSRDGRADIYFSRSANGGVTFDPDLRLDTGDNEGEADSFEPQLCTDEVSNLYVVWHDSRNSINNRDIFFNFSLNEGDTWFNSAQQLDSDGQGTANSLYPVCATDGQAAQVLWLDNRNQAYDVFYRRIINGIPEAVPEEQADIGDEDDPGIGNSLDLVIGYDRTTGSTAVAWNDDRVETARDGDNGYTDLYYQYFEDGVIAGDADQDYRIDSMFDGLGYKLDLNFHVVGNTWIAAWTDGRDITQDIYIQSFPLGEESSPPPLELIQQ